MARFGYGRHTAKVVIGTYPDDNSYPVGTNEWNEDTNNLGMLGFTSIEGTCATNVVTLTGNAVANTGLSSVLRVDGQGDAADDLDGITIAETDEYDLLYLFAESSARAITVQHASGNVSTGKIYLLAGSGTKVLSTTIPMLVIRKGNDWHEYGGGAVTTPTDITVADESSDATCFPLFVDTATGDLEPKTGSNLLFNSSSGLLTATLFAGALTGNVTGDASGSSGSCTGNSATATLSTTLTITDNESTNEDNSIIFTAGGAQTGGSLGLESDGTCTYNPSTGKITATGFIGALTGDASGSSASCTGNAATATVGTTVTITDNESTNETNTIVFTSGGTATGNLGLESDGDLTYNPSSGLVTVPALTVTGNLTVSGTTTTLDVTNLAVEDPLIQLAKANATSDALDIGFWGLYDTSTSQDLRAGLFRDANDSGKWKLFKDTQEDLTSVTAINTGATGYATATLVANIEGNITGALTGNASGTALTVTQAGQSAITSLGTLTGLTMGGALAMGGNDITNGGVIFLTEQADAESDVAGKGQIWVDTATPNKLFFTDDVGTDFDLTSGGGATLFHLFSNSTTTTYAGQTGEAQTLGTVVGTLASGVGNRDAYIRSIDSNNEGLFTVIHKNGALVEVQVA